MSGSEVRRAALLVDLENVRHGLGADAGRRFAEEPQRWVDWLAAGGDGGPRRSFVVQRCYLAHESFSTLRAPLTKAGFEVVDCSVAPESGKNSADIRLVVDAMDLLHSSDARVEEFVVVSADADVLPLLHRLRSAGRGRTLVAGDGTRPGYVRVADRVVSREVLAEACGTALPGGSGDPPQPRARGPVPAQRTPPGPSRNARRALHTIRSTVGKASEPVREATLRRRVLAVVPALGPGFDGTGSLRAFVDRHAPELEWRGDRLANPRRHRVVA